jgi:MFS family permease
MRRHRSREGVGVGERRLTIGLALTITVIAFEALAVATVLPVTARELGGLSLYGWAFSAFMLANLVTVVLAAHQADRVGPAVPFVGGLVLFTAGLLVCGLAPSMLVLVAGRAVQGLGAGAILSVAYVAIGRAFDDHSRAPVLAVMSTAWVVPGLIAPALGGAMAQHLGWRSVFLVIAALPPIAAVLAVPPLVALGVPANPSTAPGPGVRPALRLAVGAGVVLGALGARSPLLSPVLGAVGILIAVPAFRRLVPEGTLSARTGLPAAIAVRGLDTFAFFGTEAFLALTLATVRHLSPTMVGLTLTPATLSWTAGSWIQARWDRRIPRRTIVSAGIVCLVVGLALAAFTLVPGVPVGIVALAWGIAGLGQGLAYSPLTLVTLAEAEPGREGAATASLQLTDVLGTALGTGAGGAIVAVGLAAGWSRRAALGIVFALMFAAAVLALVAAARLRPGLACASAPADERPDPTIP